jgi:hypothetical protein
MVTQSIDLLSLVPDTIKVFRNVPKHLQNNTDNDKAA